MKKVIGFSLIAVLLLCTVIGVPSSTGASSPAENTFSLVSDPDPIADSQGDNPYILQSEIIFSPVEDDLTSRELGIMRLREAGCSDFTIGCFSDEDLELLSTATSVITCTSYFTEVFDEESGESSLVAISYEDFLQLEQQDVIEEEETLPILIPFN